MIKKLVFISFITLGLAGCTKESTPVDPVISIGLSDLSIRESDGVAAFILNLSSAPKTPVSFDLNVINDSAKAGIDFTAASTTRLTFASGVKTQTFSVYLLNDRVKRADRHFRIELKNPVGLIFTTDKATITIRNDNLNPEVYFTAQAQAVNKTLGLATTTLNLSYPAPERFDVPYSISGTGVYGVDHNFLSGTATFQAGESSAEIQGSLINVPGPSSNRTIVFNLGPAVDGLYLGPQKTHTMIISDNLANLVAVMSGAPSGTSNLRNLNISVVGYNVSQYKYKIATSNVCTNPSGYSAARSTSVFITDSILALPNGPIYVCVVGGNDQGVFQDYLIASNVTWIKNTNPPLAPTFSQITSPYRQISAGVILSSSPQVTAQFTGLISGYTLALFDSASCASNKEIGRATITSSVAQVTGSFTSDGDHLLSALIFDQYGQSSICSPILSKYTLDSQAPVVIDVASSTPTGFYKAGENILIAVTFSKPIVITGLATQMPYLVMNTIPTAGIANFASYSGNTATFRYTPASGQNATTLDYASQSSLVPSGSSIKDLAGNTANLTLPIANTPGRISSKATINIDTVAPLAVMAFSDGLWGVTDRTPVFTWVDSADPGGSGIVKYQISIGTQPALSDILFWTDVSSVNTFQANMALAVNITMYANVRAIDRAGNISLVTSGDGFIIDEDPPTTPVVSISATSTFNNSQSPQVSWSISLDDVSGLDHYEVALGTSPGNSNTVAWIAVAKAQNYVFSYSGTYDQSYYASVRAYDRAGNVITGVAQPFLLTRPIVDPNPMPAFINQIDVKQSTVTFSNPQSISGLSIPASIAVVGANGSPMVSINGAAPVTSGIIKNGDSIQLRMTASPFGNETYTATVNFASTSTTWSISTWSCPTNYVYVPPAASELDFCIAKYQMSVSGTAPNEMASVNPTSAPTLVNQKVAARSCQNLGIGYELVTNGQWQSLAKNIESVGFNWSSGTPGSGLMSGGVINSSIYPSPLPAPSANDNLSCNGATASCDLSAWNKYRRVMKLSTDKYIWDASGLSWQWTLESHNSDEYLNPDSYYCPNGSLMDCYYNLGQVTSQFLIDSYAPALNYTELFPNSTSANTDWGGIGSILDTHPSPSGANIIVSVSRGGSQGDEDEGYWFGGVFSARLTEGPHPVSTIERQIRPAFRLFGETPNTSTFMDIGMPTATRNAAGAYGCNFPDCTDISAGTTNGVYHPSSTCKDLASCTELYAFGANCSATEDPNSPYWIPTSPNSTTGHYFWTLACDVATGAVLTPGAATGAVRCTYAHPPGL